MWLNHRLNVGYYMRIYNDIYIYMLYKYMCTHMSYSKCQNVIPMKKGSSLGAGYAWAEVWKAGNRCWASLGLPGYQGTRKCPICRWMIMVYLYTIWWFSVIFHGYGKIARGYLVWILHVHAILIPYKFTSPSGPLSAGLIIAGSQKLRDVLLTGGLNHGQLTTKTIM